MAKCIAGPGLLSSLIVSKCGDHLPVYRSEDILVRHGLHIPRSTLCDWMHRSAMLLLPFVAFVATRVLKQSVLWTDDTPVMFFDRKGNSALTKQGESSLRRGRFWPYIARGDSPYTVFDFTIRRDRDGPIWKFIGSEPAGYRMAILFTVMANAKRHYLEPFAYVRDLLVKMSFLCTEHAVDIPDFTKVSNLSGTPDREPQTRRPSETPREIRSR